MSSTLSSLWGFERPIVQAPMAGVQDATLAIAVCRAGGLGSLPAAMLSPDQLDEQLGRLHAGAAGRPYNVNFFCHRPPVPDAVRESAWRAQLAPLYRSLGLDPAAAPSPGPAREPFGAAAAEVLERWRPPVVSFHFGLPADDLLARVRRTGARIVSSATTVEEARWLAAQGVDAVIAQGLEAGGHRGLFLGENLDDQLGTFALLPQVVRAVSVPVIAAGGIADAAGVRAARALGAAAVQVGTAYLLCPEATTSAIHRAALASEAAAHTALTTAFTGRPARGIVNRLMRELGPRPPLVPEFPGAATAIGPLRARAEALGLDDCTPLWAGQNARLCRAMPAETLTRELAGGWVAD